MGNGAISVFGITAITWHRCILNDIYIFTQLDIIKPILPGSFLVNVTNKREFKLWNGALSQQKSPMRRSAGETILTILFETTSWWWRLKIWLLGVVKTQFGHLILVFLTDSKKLNSLIKSGTKSICIVGKSWKFHLEHALNISEAENYDLMESWTWRIPFLG